MANHLARAVKDSKHPVSNLVRSDGYKKWLCDPRERSGQIEAIFQLDQPCLISYIDIGSIWCATVEIQVGGSDWPAGREFETLVHTVSLMNPTECSMGRNSVQTRMFSSDLFCADAGKRCWDRIKVICRQPYKKLAQFGLSFIRVSSSSGTQPTVDVSSKKISAPESVQDIQKHFLGKLNTGKTRSPDVLKSKLLKIAASSDVVPGSEEARAMNADSLTRTARLVLASTGQSPKIPPIGNKGGKEETGLHSNYLGSKNAPTLKDEVQKFLDSLHISASDLDNITLADLRHRLEKKKKRKLTKDEKRTFINMAKEHIADMFSKTADETDGVQVNSSVKSSNKGVRTGVNKRSVDRSTDNHVQSKNVVIDSNLANTPKNQLHFDSPKLTDTKSITPKVKRKLSNCDELSESTSKSSKLTDAKSITPKVKRKLSNCDDELSASASKKILKEHYTSVRQQLKSVEKTPEQVTKRTVLDLCKVQKPCTDHSGAVTTSPAVAFQYRGLRGLDTDGTPDSQECNAQNHRKDLLQNFSSGDQDWDFIKQSVGVDCVNMLESVTSFPWLPDGGDMDVEITGHTNGRVGKRNRGRRRGAISRGSKIGGPEVDGVCARVLLGINNRGRGQGRGEIQHANSSAPRTCSDVPVDGGDSINTRGFSKCTGCNNYFADSLLEAHQKRCAGYRSQVSSATTSQEVTPGNQSTAQEVASGIANKSAIRGRGRGRGRKTKSSVSSLEIRPTGFVKCDGCNEYFNGDTLSIHHQRCDKWKSLPSSTKSVHSPWLCSKPEHSVTNNLIGSPAAASKTSSNSTNQIASDSSNSGQRLGNGPIRSPPWLMAAERRLQQQHQCNEQIAVNTDASFVDDVVSVSSVPDAGLSARVSAASSLSTLSSPSQSSTSTSSAVAQSQRQMLEKYQTMAEGALVNTPVNAPMNAPARISTVSSHVTTNRRVSTSRVSTSQGIDISIDISDEEEFGDVENLDGDTYRVLGGDLGNRTGRVFGENSGNGTGRVLGESAVQVECPLCGDFFPTFIIEMHAASCYL